MNAAINAIVVSLIKTLAAALFGSGVLDRILARVRLWAEETFPEGMPQADQNAQKRHGVMDDLDTIGLQLSEAQKRLGVELAVQVHKRESADV